MWTAKAPGLSPRAQRLDSRVLRVHAGGELATGCGAGLVRAGVSGRHVCCWPHQLLPHVLCCLAFNVMTVTPPSVQFSTRALPPAPAPAPALPLARGVSLHVDYASELEQQVPSAAVHVSCLECLVPGQGDKGARGGGGYDLEFLARWRGSLIGGSEIGWFNRKGGGAPSNAAPPPPSNSLSYAPHIPE